MSIFVKALPTASGHRLGMIVMGSQNGDASQENNAASIEAFSGAAWSAASSHSSYIIFSTTSIGATSRTERMRIAENGNVGIGAAPNASALLDVSSTTKGLLVPRMTSGQKTGISSPANGLIVYDTDLNHLCIYNGTAWRWLGARAFTPANTADAAGSVGDMAFDNSYTYTKTAAGWARAALSTF